MKVLDSIDRRFYQVKRENNTLSSKTTLKVSDDDTAKTVTEPAIQPAAENDKDKTANKLRRQSRQQKLPSHRWT